MGNFVSHLWISPPVTACGYALLRRAGSPLSHRLSEQAICASCGEARFRELRGSRGPAVEILVSCLWWHWVSVAMAATAMAAASMASLSLRGGSSFQEFNGLAPSSSFRPSLAVPPTHRPCESLNEILAYPTLVILGLITTNILYMPLIEMHLGPYPFPFAYHY